MCKILRVMKKRRQGFGFFFPQQPDLYTLLIWPIKINDRTYSALLITGKVLIKSSILKNKCRKTLGPQMPFV